ncbi:hypothetical protein V8D89_008417 [Ganoderma adspersum]
MKPVLQNPGLEALPWSLHDQWVIRYRVGFNTAEAERLRQWRSKRCRYPPTPPDTVCAIDDGARDALGDEYDRAFAGLWSRLSLKFRQPARVPGSRRKKDCSTSLQGVNGDVDVSCTGHQCSEPVTQTSDCWGVKQRRELDSVVERAVHSAESFCCVQATTQERMSQVAPAYQALGHPHHAVRRACSIWMEGDAFEELDSPPADKY